MTGRLQSELRQSKPFACLEVEAVISVARTADAFLRHLEEALKTAGLSPTQYNVLRILRGAAPQGLACGEIAGRLITRDPDITRLLDRMEHRGLLERARETRDRRVVITRIRPAGLRLLKTLDRPLVDLQRRRLGHLGPRRLRLLIELLEAARGGKPEEILASKRVRQASKRNRPPSQGIRVSPGLKTSKESGQMNTRRG